jgi:hypothetical protein
MAASTRLDESDNRAHLKINTWQPIKWIVE